MGTMATTPMTATFTGDASLRKRPMGRVTDPLSLFGTQAYGRKGGRLPMTVVGRRQPGAGPLHPARGLGAGEIRGAAGRPERAGSDRGDRKGTHARPFRTDAAGLWRATDGRKNRRGQRHHPDRPARIAPANRGRAARSVLRRLPGLCRADRRGVGYLRARCQPEPDPQRALSDAGRNGRRHRVPEPAHRRRRTGRRSARAVFRTT